MAENKIVSITQTQKKVAVTNGNLKIDVQATPQAEDALGRLKFNGQQFTVVPYDKIPSQFTKSRGGFTPNAMRYARLAKERHPHTTLHPITTVGRDEAPSFRADLEQLGIPSDLIVECGDQTGVSFIILDQESQDRVIFDGEGKSLIDLEEEKLEALLSQMAQLDAILAGHIRDPKGRILNELLSLSTQLDLGLNPGRTERSLIVEKKVNLESAELFYIQLNREEAISMSHRHSVEDEALLDEMQKTFNNPRWVVLTKGADGLAVRDTSTGKTHQRNAYSLDVVKTTTGVGDITAIALKLDLLHQTPIEEAIDWAVAVGGAYVETGRVPDSEVELKQWVRAQRPIRLEKAA